MRTVFRQGTVTFMLLVGLFVFARHVFKQSKFASGVHTQHLRYLTVDELRETKAMTLRLHQRYFRDGNSF